MTNKLITKSNTKEAEQKEWTVMDENRNVSATEDSMAVERIVNCLNNYKEKNRSSSSFLNYSVLYKEEVDSTNLWAKDLARSGAPEGTVVLADAQTAGKGRRGRSWASGGGHSIYMSLILRPDIAPEQASMLTLVMGLAVTKACRKILCFDNIIKSGNRINDGRIIESVEKNTESMWNIVESEKNIDATKKKNELLFLDAKIKWPNDVVISGKKVCGILTEMGMKSTGIDYVIAGIGINVNAAEFPVEIQETATSLAIEAGYVLKREELVVAVLEQISIYYKKLLETGDLTNLLDEYNQVLVNREREIRVLDPKGEYRGIATGINKKGELLVMKEDGTQVAVYAGEVSVRGIYGYV